ncbi:GntR family transcriptional regulator [Streptomyces polygonati]|uniref:GntR family transcriptional regulator n=1 Tax=Streptomyces polygonati TaxID=1617087 RepID=UPI0036DE6ACA
MGQACTDFSAQGRHSGGCVVTSPSSAGSPRTHSTPSAVRSAGPPHTWEALGVLQQEGVAESRKGAGVFVREFRPVRRRGIDRLSARRWGAGGSIWEADAVERDLDVDRLSVGHTTSPESVARVLELPAAAEVCVRSRRYVLDGKPVLATSYLSAELLAGTAITREDTGPGGVYARLAEIGHRPAHFREEVRSRMPSQDEAERLGLSPGTPVILIHRTAFTADGRAVELNEMTLDAAAYVLEYDFDA